MKRFTESLEKFFAILKFAGWQGFLLTALILSLLIVYWNRLEGEINWDDKLWELIDPVSAISTFIITLFLLYNQTRQRWEDKLEKLLDVDYICANGNEKGKEIAKVIGAYLAGESDVRAWAQSLGAQIMGNLNFDMNWDDPRPVIIRGQDGVFYKKYHVIIYLTDCPFDTDENYDAKRCAERFIKRKFQYSSIEGSPDNLPIIWERKDPNKKMDVNSEELE